MPSARGGRRDRDYPRGRGSVVEVQHVDAVVALHRRADGHFAVGAAVVTVDSGESRSNAGPGYNACRRECEEACRLLGVSSLSEADPDALPEPLDRRARHVVEENARVEATISALRAEDLPAVGELLDASHASVRDLYEVSTPAVERTVRRGMRAQPGARILGGGFGGHVLALLPAGVDPPPGARAVRPSAGARLR